MSTLQNGFGFRSQNVMLSFLRRKMRLPRNQQFMHAYYCVSVNNKCNNLRGKRPTATSVSSLPQSERIIFHPLFVTASHSLLFDVTSRLTAFSLLLPPPGDPVSALIQRTKSWRYKNNLGTYSLTEGSLYTIRLPRVLEYLTVNYSSNFYYSSTRYLLLFPVSNFHFRLQFRQSIDMLLDLWKLEASRFHLQLASLEIDLNVYMQRGCLFNALTFRTPGTLTDHPFYIRHWQLVLNYFSINEYKSAR